MYFLNDMVTESVSGVGHRYLLYMEGQYFFDCDQITVPATEGSQLSPCIQILESGNNFQIGSSPPTK